MYIYIKLRLQLKAHIDLPDWMTISGMKSYEIQPFATHQSISVTL